MTTQKAYLYGFLGAPVRTENGCYRKGKYLGVYRSVRAASRQAEREHHYKSFVIRSNKL